MSEEASTSVIASLARQWIAPTLPGLPDPGGTYAPIPLAAVPDVPRNLIATWDWVPRLGTDVEWGIGSKDDASGAIADAARRGLALPERFVDFVAEPSRRRGMRSMTGCWWSLERNPITDVEVLGLPVLPFLFDQQDVAFWFLALGEGGGAVLASWLDLVEDKPDSRDDVCVVAPSFEEFIYRFWIENEIGLKLGEGDELMAEQSAYYEAARRLQGPGAVP